MKRLAILTTLISIGFLMTGCFSTKLVGDLNMVSNRNIESNTDYVLLQRYTGEEKKDFRKAKTKTIEDAIDKTVKKVQGGEFLKNAKIYMVKKGKDDYYFVVSGDVWGIRPENADNK